MTRAELREKILDILRRSEIPDIVAPYRSYPGLPDSIAMIKMNQILAIFEGWKSPEEVEILKNMNESGYYRK
jgi:hypothetical protein